MKVGHSVKAQLIRLYGSECFIDKLQLRKDRSRRAYSISSEEKEKLKSLTYHHILERRNGGKTTVENGALLSVENHQWFNAQSEKKQSELNKAFQKYKKCGVVFVNKLDPDFDVRTIEVVMNEKAYNRAKVTEQTRKVINNELEL